MPAPVHLVGSIGLDTVQDVLETSGKLLGPHLKRIPDGEPGGRRLWISWQYPLLRASPFLRVDDAPGQQTSAGFRKLRLVDDIRPADLRFGELGYAREARASYQDFLRARSAGAVGRDIRFQVCLPTPLAVVDAFCAKAAIADIEPAYERAMLREVSTICAEIPHQDLCIQWDVCVEMILWDGRSQFYSAVAESTLIERFIRLCRAVPAEVELGFHLCYGDFDAKHFIEPLDAQKMVELANALARNVPHAIAYLHMPVPRERDDPAFFVPLKQLQLEKGTELYLGLVHPSDGLAGAKKRIAAAREAVGAFGVASECGLGRCKTPDDVRKLLALHAEIAAQA